MRYSLVPISLIAIAACGDGKQGNVSLQLTGESSAALSAEGEASSESELQAAVVTVSEVYLQGDSRVTLRGEDFTTDLIELANTTADLVAAAEVEAGTYQQLRFVITGAYIQLASEAGTEIFATANYKHVPEGAAISGELKMPSAGSSGLKVDLPGEGLKVEADEEAELLIHFDITESLGHEAGASGQWVMEPRLEAFALSEAASVRVEVAASAGVEAEAMAGLQAELRDAEGDFEGRIALAEADGMWVGTFNFLNPEEGPFGLRLITDSGVEIDTSVEMPTEVSVAAGAEAKIHVEVTGVSS